MEATSILKLEEKTKKLQAQNDVLDDQKKLFADIGQDIEQSIVSSLSDAVEGTKTLGEAAIGVLNKLKRKLIEVAIQQAVSGIGGKIGGFFSTIFGAREMGGSVKANQPYIVGERRPELFVPNRSGTILPSVPTGGGTTNIVNVSVDASGSAVQGDNANAQQLGQTIANVVKEVIIDEQRSGGLLA